MNLANKQGTVSFGEAERLSRAGTTHAEPNQHVPGRRRTQASQVVGGEETEVIEDPGLVFVFRWPGPLDGFTVVA
jgi:hypothetical protein